MNQLQQAYVCLPANFLLHVEKSTVDQIEIFEVHELFCQYGLENSYEILKQKTFLV